MIEPTAKRAAVALNLSTTPDRSFMTNHVDAAAKHAPPVTISTAFHQQVIRKPLVNSTPVLRVPVAASVRERATDASRRPCQNTGMLN